MVDEAVVTDKLQLIDGYVEDLERLRGMDRVAYVKNMVTQRAVERTFMNLIQAVIDAASHIRSTENLGPAETSREELQALGDAGIISAETQSKMEEAVGFRNVLAHRYGDVDHDVVYDVLHEELEWFERFQIEIARWIKGRDEQ